MNRVFRDKPGGLVVDYLGLADQPHRPRLNRVEDLAVVCAHCHALIHFNHLTNNRMR